MESSDSRYDQSIRRQIEINQARTPTQRFQALCDLLDAVREMAPRDPASCERRRRALQAREREKEQFREQCRRWASAQRDDDSTCV